MSDEKQHINPWADKLQEISLPDEGLVWESMSDRLDNDLPEGKKKDYRRWVLLIILLLLLLGVCNCPTGIRNGLYKKGNTITTVSETAAGSEKKIGHGAYDTVSYSRKDVDGINVFTDSLSKGRSSDTIENDKLIVGDTVEINKGNDDRNTKNTNRINARDKINSGASGTSSNATNTGGKNASNSNKKNNEIQNTKPVIGLSTTSSSGNDRTGSTSKSKRNKRSAVTFDSSYGNADANAFGRRVTGNKNDKEIAGSADVKVTMGRRKNDTIPNSIDVKKVTNKTDTGQIIPPVVYNMLGNDSAIVEAQKSKRAQITKDSTKTADSLKIAKAIAQKDSLKTDSTKAEKGKKEKDKSKENGWAAAVGLNHFFAISGQQRSTLNSDGVTGTWKDYLPVPQVRYYFNRKLYVQLEAQFNAPQYTQTLLGKLIPADSSGNGTQTSVFVKKLFYFNLPLSVYYSPFKNFYLGTGIQISKLSNGVGTVEEQQYFNGRPDSSNADIKTQSLKSDSLYKRISTNEFRWLVDANYHLKSFTIGARYNQAFSNFINIQVSSTQLTQARNSSLQMYLRYTFWRSKKLKGNGIY